MKAAWLSFWTRVYFVLRLRGPVNWLQRWYKGELRAPRAPLPEFGSPAAVEAYIAERFEFRPDQTRIGGLAIPLDWVTDPEVFQARLLSGEQRDGDCDDYAAWSATAFARVSGVDRSYLLSCGAPKGGHAVAVFRYYGDWFLDNYGISPLADPNDAPAAVARWIEGTDDAAPTFYAFELVTADGPTWQAEAIGPNGKVAP